MTLFDANDFFSNAAGIPNSPHTHDQYGGLISGPIKHNKIFFLFDFEKQRDDHLRPDRRPHSPLTCSASGNFSQTDDFRCERKSGAGYCLQPVQHIAQRSPHTFCRVTSFRTSMLDPVAKALLAYMPEPNVTGDAGTNYNNYRKNVPTHFSQYQLDGRVDYQINDKHRLGARYSYLNNERSNADHVRGRCIHLHPAIRQRGVDNTTGRSIPEFCTPAASVWISLTLPGVTDYPSLDDGWVSQLPRSTTVSRECPPLSSAMRTRISSTSAAWILTSPTP